jgi:hypothetical protein
MNLDEDQLLMSSPDIKHKRLREPDTVIEGAFADSMFFDSEDERWNNTFCRLNP